MSVEITSPPKPSKPRGLRLPTLVLLVAILATVSGLVAVGSPLIALALVALCALIAVIVEYSHPVLLLHVLVVAVFIDGFAAGPISVGRLAVVGALLVMALRWAQGWRPPPLPTLAWLPAVLLVLWAWASGLWVDYIESWAFAMGQFGLAIIYFAAFAWTIEKTSEITAVLRTYLISATIVTIYGFYQFAIGDRATGFQADWNIFALTEAMAIPIAYMLARQGGQHLWWLATMPLLVMAVLSSGSRGGLMALVGVAIGIIWMFERRAKKRRIGMWIGVAVLGGLIAMAAMATNPRLNPTSISNDRGSGRFDIWFVAWETSLEHPIFGLGAGGFIPVSLDLLRYTPGVELIKSQLLYTDGVYVHNQYLNMLVELGIIGLGLFLLLLVATFVVTWRSCNRLGNPPAVDALIPMQLGFAPAIFFLSIPNNKVLWIMIGLAAALGYLAKRDGSRSEEDSAPPAAIPATVANGPIEKDTS